MKRLAFLLAIVCGTLVFGGCATHRAAYQAPLDDVGVLSSKSRDEMKIPEVSHSDLTTIKPGERPAIESDEAGYWMAMDQAEEQLRSSGQLVRDAKLGAYLEQVTARLVPEYSKDIRIYLIKAPYFNATMAPNGALQIWTGLLLRVENEAQLAAVIGHEIGHYLRRHTLQRMQDAISKTSTMAFVQLATAVAGVAPVGDLLQLGTIGSIQAFSRDQEREADGYGIALMTRAGYDPREAAKVWERVLAEQEADENNRSPFLFFASHPAGRERYEALKELGDKVTAHRAEPFQRGDLPYREAVAPHRHEYLRDELNLHNYDATEKLLQMLLENPHNPSELRYFNGELYRLRGEEGDKERALAEYEKAVLAGTPPSEVYRAMGLLYSSLGRKQDAAIAFKTYLQQTPECTDRKMVLYMIKEMEQ